MMEEVKTMMDLSQIGPALAIGLGALGPGVGIGIAVKGLMDAMARQPEIAPEAFKNFLIGAALSEACAIYALVVAFMLLFK